MFSCSCREQSNSHKTDSPTTVVAISHPIELTFLKLNTNSHNIKKCEICENNQLVDQTDLAPNITLDLYQKLNVFINASFLTEPSEKRQKEFSNTNANFGFCNFT